MITLNNGYRIPNNGFGTYWQKKELSDTVPIAYRIGYRLFDISDNYNNEIFFGEAIHRMAKNASDIIVISKFSQPSRTSKLDECFEESRFKLGGKLDIYLLHWPYPFLWRVQWKKIEDLYLQNKCSAIGVCNFDVKLLKKLLKTCRVKPMINQIERHPCFQQSEIVDYCKENNIQIISYSPLARMHEQLLKNDILREIAIRHNKTVEQVILRWSIDTNTLPIPGSTSEDHINTNYSIRDFRLTDSEINKINTLEQGLRVRFNPRTRFSILQKLYYLGIMIRTILGE